MTTTSLVVMEPGSEWPGQVGDSMNVVSAPRCDDLLLLTRAKLLALERSKQHLHIAVLAVNSVVDAPAALRRAEVARLLLGSVTRCACGRIVLCASHEAEDELREQLLTLTGALTKDLWGTTATVSLRFTEAGGGQAVATT
jgi:hypothetical protein